MNGLPYIGKIKGLYKDRNWISLGTTYDLSFIEFQVSEKHNEVHSIII